MAASEFEEKHYNKIEQIRMYKKYVRENLITFLEFDSNGVLCFMSGNPENETLNNLTKIWEEGVPVLHSLFPKNVKLGNEMRKALKGSSKTERLFEITQYIKGRIIRSHKQVEKIQVIVEERDAPNHNYFENGAKSLFINDRGLK